MARIREREIAYPLAVSLPSTYLVNRPCPSAERCSHRGSVQVDLRNLPYLVPT